MDMRYVNNIRLIECVADHINQNYFGGKIQYTLVYKNGYLGSDDVSVTSDRIVEEKNNVVKKIIVLRYDQAINDKKYLALQLFTDMLAYEGRCIDEKRYTRNGYYFNKKFATSAIKLGCEVKEANNKIYGYRISDIPKECKEFLDTITFDKYNTMTNQEKSKSSCSAILKQRKYKCPKCGHSFRATTAINAKCNNCGIDFEIDKSGKYYYD